jgi:hypothetical protein
MRPTLLLPALSLIIFLQCAAMADGGSTTQPSSQPTTRSSGVTVKQSSDGTILLNAKDVSVHGTTVRYEPAPNKNTVGYWTRRDDWVSWDFQIDRPGKFMVIILQGCGKGSGGSEVSFAIDAQQLKTTVQDTGGFQNFVSRTIGSFELSAGKHTLAVTPLTKPGQAVMDLRSVTLKPVQGG